MSNLMKIQLLSCSFVNKVMQTAITYYRQLLMI